MISNMDFLGHLLLPFFLVVPIVRARAAGFLRRWGADGLAHICANVRTDERSLVSVFLYVNQVFKCLDQGFVQPFAYPASIFLAITRLAFFTCCANVSANAARFLGAQLTTLPMRAACRHREQTHSHSTFSSVP
jgi:hypothetical protein